MVAEVIMELTRILKTAARWWWLGAIPVVVVVAYVALTYRAPATSYKVVLRFTTGGEPATPLSADYDRYYAWLASEYIANGLADLARTSVFARDVSDRLAAEGLDVPPQAIQGSLVTDNAQSILVVDLTWSDADQAVAIATAVGDELLAAGPSFYPQMDGIGEVAKLADPPAPVPQAPSLRTQLLGPAIRVLLAAFIGAGLILAAHVLDPAIRESRDLQILEVPVVGVVPRTRVHRE